MNEEHSERAMDVASSSIGGMLEDVRRSDPRGHMHRFKRLMADDDARAFLRSQNVAHVGTVDERGWPHRRALDLHLRRRRSAVCAHRES